MINENEINEKINGIMEEDKDKNRNNIKRNIEESMKENERLKEELKNILRLKELDKENYKLNCRIEQETKPFKFWLKSKLYLI